MTKDKISAAEEKIAALHDEVIGELKATQYKTDLNKLIIKLDEAARLSRQIANMPQLVMSLWRKGVLTRYLTRMDEAIEILNEAAKIALKNKIVKEGAGVYDSLGNIYIELGELDKARQAYTNGLELVKNSDDFAQYGKLLGALANVDLQEGNSIDALKRCLEAIEICRTNNIKIGDSLYIHAGIAYNQLGESAKAIDCYQEALRVSDTINPMNKSSILNNIANVYYERGNNDETIKYLEESLALYDGIQMDAQKVLKLANLSIAYATVGKNKEAKNYLKQAEEIAENFKSNVVICRIAWSKATIALNEENFDEARKFFSISMNTALDYGDQPFYIKSLHQIANISDNETKEKFLLQALELSIEKKYKRFISEISESLSNYYESIGNPALALEYYKSHHQLFTELQNEESERKIQVMTVESQLEKLKNELEKQRQMKEEAIRNAEKKQQELLEFSFQLSMAGRAIDTIRRHARRGMQAATGKQRTNFRQIIQSTGTQLSSVHWDAFENRFRNMHSDFTDRLRKNYPTLSPTELKVCALIKTGCSLKEAASLLSVSPRTLENHRISIRKKMGLTKSQNLTNFIASL